MIVIVEGPDGAGKTTLMRTFKAWGWRYAYHDAPPVTGEDKFETYTAAILSVKPSEYVIFDRFHLSEHVYGQVVRGKTQIELEHVRILNRILYARGCLTIFCLPALRTIEKNWGDRLDVEYVKETEQLRAVVDLYRQLRSEYLDLNAVTFNYEFDSPAAIPGLAPKILPEGMIGNPGGRFLLVGERSSDPRDLAFYSSKRSAHFLNEALWEAGFQEHELTLTNALTYLKEERPLRQLYGGRTVIALGRVAQGVCLRQGVPFLPAPHPQFVKRFKSKQRARYVELLRAFRGDQ